jgi:ubiquinone/menaquinone biosynthesis C-methylase UbiE
VSIAEKRRAFVDRTARKPSGERGISLYNDPKSHYRSFRSIMKKLKLSPDDTYLEVGCGGGILLRMALARAQSAVAIDHSPEMVELARRNNQQSVDRGRADIRCGDAAALPWGDNTVSAAASAHMFFFVEQPQEALDEIYRVLKPRGRFAMVTMGNGLLGKVSFGWFFSLRTYSDQEMRSMLQNAGFSRTDVKTRFGVSQTCYAVK